MTEDKRARSNSLTPSGRVCDKSRYEVGQYGEASSELVAASGLSSYNIKLSHETEELWREEDSEDTQEEFGIVSRDNKRHDYVKLYKFLSQVLDLMNRLFFMGPGGKGVEILEKISDAKAVEIGK